jgi:histidyl-tRNA synthetase
VFDEKLWLESYKLATEIRDAGLNVMVSPEPAKLQKQFKFADKMKMKVALVLGPDEVEKGLVVVKNLSNGEQVQVKREALVESIKGILGNA